MVNILHEDDVVAVAEKTFVKRGVVVIATPTAPSATYVQAELTSMKAAIDAIRAQLTASGVTG